MITLVELPLVLPPAVAGIGLLAALGPQGVFGGAIGDRLVLTTAGVVCALTFVSAPFYMRQAQAAFEALDQTWLDASRTLGATEARTFARIAIPAAGPGLLAGVALAWGRALGEFGATLMFAGSFRGITQTVPLAIYERFGTDFTSALALSAVLVGVSAALLLSVKLLSGAGGSAVLRVEARARLGALDLDVALEVAAGRCLALAGPVRGGQDLDPARRGRAAAAGARARSPAARRCGWTPRAGSTSRPSGAAAATSSRSTRCSGTCAPGRTSPTR